MSNVAIYLDQDGRVTHAVTDLPSLVLFAVQDGAARVIEQQQLDRDAIIAEFCRLKRLARDTAREIALYAAADLLSEHLRDLGCLPWRDLGVARAALGDALSRACADGCASVH